MHFQLQEIPEDFFVDIVSRNNFLTTTLQVGNDLVPTGICDRLWEKGALHSKIEK